MHVIALCSRSRKRRSPREKEPLPPQLVLTRLAFLPLNCSCDTINPTHQRVQVLCCYGRRVSRYCSCIATPCQADECLNLYNASSQPEASTSAKPLTRHAATYDSLEPLSSTFKIQKSSGAGSTNGAFRNQYASVYYNRLMALKKVVKENADKRWASVGELLVCCRKLLYNH